MNKSLQMVVTDLDGTLLNNERTISEQDIKTLHRLGEQNILRIIATGRSYYSLKKVLHPDFPVDYVVLSSGAGIMNWNTKKLIHSFQMNKETVQHTASLLIGSDTDFMLHESLPDNHYFVYRMNSRHGRDFKTRLEIYAEFGRPYKYLENLPQEASQFLTIFPSDKEFPENIKLHLKNIDIIRATSPLDHKSNWYELFPEGVSKATAIQTIATQFGINPNHTLALGNDYNDQDLLDWAGMAFIVANAPDTLKSQYKVTVSNQESALTQVVKHYKL